MNARIRISLDRFAIAVAVILLMLAPLVEPRITGTLALVSLLGFSLIARPRDRKWGLTAASVAMIAAVIISVLLRIFRQ